MIETGLGNETLFVLITLLELAFVLVCWRFGRPAVFVAIVVNIILVATFGPKLVAILGYVTNVTNVCYATIFLATNILNEHFGTGEAYKSVWLGFIGLALFVIMGQFVLDFDSVQNGAASEAMDALFSGTPRVAAASFLAYAIAQNFAVWLYDRIRKWTGPRRIWLRAILSPVVGQFMDSVIFFGLAFGGAVANAELAAIILAGWAVKTAIALIHAPVIYASYWVSGKKLPA